MFSVNSAAFKQKVNTAIEKVKTILDLTREPQFADKIPHEYVDKYLLANFITNATIASQLQCLEEIGLTPEHLTKLKEWSGNRTVSIALKSEQKCSFVKQTTRKEESKSQKVTEYSGAISAKKVEKVVTTITEYFWNFVVTYELVAFKGNDRSNCLTLASREGSCELVTTVDKTPKPKVTVIDPISLNITWLLHQIESKDKVIFAIDRKAKGCNTPRRNPQIERALAFMSDCYAWCNKIDNYFRNSVFTVQPKHGLSLSEINNIGIFSPVLPLFESDMDKKQASKSEDKMEVESTTEDSRAEKKTEQQPKDVNFDFYGNIDTKVLLSMRDINLFLAEQKRTIAEKLVQLKKTIPPSKALISTEEASLLAMLRQMMELCNNFLGGINFIEEMLRSQLISAIGKVVTVKEFAEYMTFHNRKLFKAVYQSLPFCYCVRRPDHFPEGVLTIEADTGDGKIPQPIVTTVRKEIATTAMKFPINAATNISFYGERYVHGFVTHQFSNNSASTFQLIARARQFSSFMLLVGKIAGPSTFEPLSGIIIKNKDDLKIPLMLEQIPSPKEFKDAIESLSPEQQRFAKAFRSMQLESTLFGVCIIQIKPQLEKVLNLEPNSLTKEIKLTQHLMDLFIKYQIPSDLLAAEDGNSKEAKLNQVKQLVKDMESMINECKEKELIERKQEVQHQNMSAILTTTSVRPSSSSSSSSSSSRGGRGRGRSSARFGSARGRSAGGGGGAGGMFSGGVAGGLFANLSSNSRQSKSIASPKPSPSPTPTLQTTPTTDTPKCTPKDADQSANFDDSTTGQEDYTKLPTKLDAQFEKLDVDSALRPTIITTATSWTKKSKPGLLGKEVVATLVKDQQKSERDSAFDLLDALSKSGLLSFEDATLHIIVAATHCFDKSVVNTVIQDNVNPIEKVERSLLIVASTIHKKQAKELINTSQLDRVKTYSPMLFDDDDDNDNKE